MNKQLFNTIKILVISLMFSLGLSYVFADWTAPDQNPPLGNASAPINVSVTDQTKAGDICTTKGGTTKCLSTGGGASDNLGNHTATTTLNMAGNNISNANGVSASLLTFKGTGADSGQSPYYYGIHQEAGPWAWPYPDLKIAFHTGIKYDAYYGYGGHRFFTGYDGSGNPTGETMSIGNGDQNVRVTNDLYANDVYSSAAGKWMSSGLSCTTKGVSSATAITISCDAGYTMTGGGCIWRSDGNDRYVYSVPDGNGWFCADYDGVLSAAYVRCCK